METYVDGYSKKYRNYWRSNLQSPKAYVPGAGAMSPVPTGTPPTPSAAPQQLEVEKVGTLLTSSTTNVGKISPSILGLGGSILLRRLLPLVFQVLVKWRFNANGNTSHVWNDASN